VLNAGTHRPVDPRALKPEDFEKLVAVNLLGTVNCLAAVLPPMLARGHGRIAVVASVAGYRGLPTAAAYGMTKAGLINMAEALRVELAPCGIVVQIVNPGFVRTPLTDRNDFPMPFLMEPEAAADAFFRGLQSDRFEIAFPWRFVWMMKLLRCLPAPLAFAVTRRMTPKEQKKP
jgi:short-subunit dehydrogenase